MRSMRRDPYVTATVTAVLYFLIYNTVRFALHKELDINNAFVGAIVFWIVYFLLQLYLNSRKK